GWLNGGQSGIRRSRRFRIRRKRQRSGARGGRLLRTVSQSRSFRLGRLGRRAVPWQRGGVGWGRRAGWGLSGRSSQEGEPQSAEKSSQSLPNPPSPLPIYWPAEVEANLLAWRG